MTLLVFKDKTKFKGVCLEFDLEIIADTPIEAKKSITDYSFLWLKNVVKNKLPEELLNKPAPKKYWKRYGLVLQEEKLKVDVERKPTISLKQPSQDFASFNFPYPLFSGFNFA